MNSTDALGELGVTHLDSSSGRAWTGADVVQILILLIIAVFGTLGNILLIITIHRDRKLRIPGNYFIINLAISDLIITAFSIPVIISNFVRYHTKLEVQIEVSGFCQTTAYLKVIGLHVSWYSLAFIALNRYFSVCRMQEYATYFTKRKVLTTIGLIWSFIVLINFPIMAGWAVPRNNNLPENSTEGYYYAYRRGRPPVIYDQSSHDCVLGVRKDGGYTYANGFFVMSLPLISIIFCYSLVSMEIVRSRRKVKGNMPPKQQKKRYKKERKISLMLATVVIVFIACWAPVIIYDHTHTIDNEQDLDVARLIFSWLALSNSAMNPGLYAMLSVAFRDGYRRLIILIFSKIACWKLSTDSPHPDVSSGSTSRNESGTFSRRITMMTNHKAKHGKNTKGSTVFQTHSMVVTGRDTGVYTTDGRSHEDPGGFNRNLTLTTAQIETRAHLSVPCDNNSISTYSHSDVQSRVTSATPTHSERCYQPSSVGSSLTLPRVGVVDSEDESISKHFTSLLDQMDDSSSSYTEGGIYLGGSVVKINESGENSRVNED